MASRTTVECELLSLNERLYSVDWCGRVNRVLRFWAEFKRRNHSSTERDHVILSFAKWERLMELSRMSNCQSLFFVMFNDGLHYTHIRDEYDIRVTGRKDRNDPHDTEPCVIIPMNEFVKLADFPE